MWSEQGQPRIVGSPGGLLLMDGHAYAYRAFHAIRKLTAPDGRPTNAIFGFIKMMEKLLDWLSPTHAAVVWDGGMSPQRLGLLPEYKANRPSMPDDLRSQIAQLQRYLPAVGLASIQMAEVEADDCLATIASKASQNGLATLIASSDKDFMQLVRPGLGLVNPADPPPKIWSETDVLTKTGVRPDQVVDWLSLVGDAVDNIRGVPGIGPKTASKLLLQFGSVAAMYDRIEEVDSPKLREGLRQSASMVARNRDLIRLDESVKIELTLSDLGRRKPDANAVAALYREWGFGAKARKQTTASEMEQDLFATTRAS
jgi:DNA polymerase I